MGFLVFLKYLSDLRAECLNGVLLELNPSEQLLEVKEQSVDGVRNVYRAIFGGMGGV